MLSDSEKLEFVDLLPNCYQTIVDVLYSRDPN